jgi:hypothetical protein
MNECANRSCRKTVHDRKYCSEACETAIRYPDAAQKREKIKELRLERRKISDIAAILCCSRGTVSSICSQLMAAGEVPYGLTPKGWKGHKEYVSLAS